MNEPRGQAAGVAATHESFRLTMRSDNPRRRLGCVVLLALSGAMLLLRSPHWDALLLAGLFALPGGALLLGWIRPVVYELVLDRDTLRWGKLQGSQQVVSRSHVASMYFGDDSGAAELLTGDRKQLPMEILGGSIKALARATARLWPGVEILTRFEDGSSIPNRERDERAP